MNLLREYIRELLTESIDSKIMSMIDRAEDAGFKVRVKSDYAAVYDPSLDVSGYPVGYVGFKNRVAGVKWSTVPGSLGGYGKCLGARAVTTSGSRDFGMGPLAYDVAIEASGGLMSDRLSVSSDAKAVWKYYMDNRADVIIQQLDNEENKLTPEEDDNCDHPVPFRVKSPLTKKYSKTGTPVMDELRRRGMLEEE